ncbi:ATP-dependent helicase, partial [Desulfobulbus sp. US4]|nr:ATP-dependent helicase [Desulfobulbus sp. US4]
MNASEKTTSQRIDEYTALAPVQKAIVGILAVNVAYCAAKRMLTCLEELGFTCPETDAPYHVRNIQPLQNELIDKGLLLKSNKGLCCPESIRQPVTRDCLLQGDFPRIAQAVQKTMMEGKPPHNIGIYTYKQYARSMQMALFSGKSIEDVYSVLNNVKQYFSDTPPEESIFIHLLSRPFSSQVIDKISPTMRCSVMGLLLNATMNRLEPAEEIVDYLLTSFDKTLYEAPEILNLISYCLLSGDTGSAISLISRLSEERELERLSRTGWLAFNSGHYEEARTYFEQNLQLFRKMSRQKKVFFQNEVGLIHLLTLLHGNDRILLSQGLEYIEIVQKKGYHYASLTQAIKPVFQQQLGLDETGAYTSSLDTLADQPLPFLISHLLLLWTDKAKAQKNIPALEKVRDRAKKNGYTWMAAELSSILAALTHNEKKKINTALAKKLHTSCDTVSCVGLVKKVPKWEKTLNGLLTITDPSAVQAVQGEQRLIWLLDYEEHYNECVFTPKMQKKTKRGTWTKGRPVGMKNLYNNFQSMEGLRPQDRQVCQAIKVEYYSSWGYGYGTKEYEIDQNLALPALVGHPLLFLADAPDVKVELVMAEPELEIREEKGRLRMCLTPLPPADDDDEIRVIRDTPTRFKLFRFTAKHWEIASFIGKGMTIPKSGAQKARKVVESLSSVVTVLSDLDGTAEAETREADSRPHAHIIPCHNGIQVEFLVKPCGDSGSSFRAGRGSKNVLSEIEGKKIQTVRDFVKEQKQLVAITKACPTLTRIKPMDDQWQVEDPEYALELLLELKNCDDALVLEWPQGEKFSVRKETSSSAFSLQIKKERDWFKATGSLEIDDTLSLDLQKLLSMLNQETGRFIQLDDGTFLSITKALRKRLDELAAFSEKHGKGVRFAPLAALAW